MPNSPAPLGAEREEMHCDGRGDIHIPLKGLSEGKAWSRLSGQVAPSLLDISRRG